MSQKLENVGKFAETKENCQIELTQKNEQTKTETNISEQNEENYVANKIKSMTPKAAMALSEAECSDEHATKATTTATKTDTTDNPKPASESYKFKEPAAQPAAATSTSYTTINPTSTPTAQPPPTATILKKTPSDFVFGKCIGEGSFSSVYLALGRQDRRECAIKVCDKRHILRERKQVYVRREREVLQVMSHTPGFVNLICTFQDNRSLYFVMTFAPNGELFPHIKRVGCFSVECARHYAAELVLACEQMHRRNVVHRDLKPENILLDAKMHTLIADFGSAKLLTAEEVAVAVATYDAPEPPTTPSPSSSATSLTCYDDCDDVFGDEGEVGEAAVAASQSNQRYRHKRKGSFVGTAQYVSPEVLQNMPIIPAADLWALGCIIYHMIAGMPPFRGYNDFAIFKEILAANFEFPENFDKDGEALVRLLLKMKPTERLGARDELSIDGAYNSVRSHAFFAGIDFKNLRQQTPPEIRPRLPTFSLDDENAAVEASKIGSLVNELAAAWKYVCTENAELDGNAAEKLRLLDEQKTDKWHYFTENEIILRRGLVNRHKGLFATKLMLLLTTGPQLIYVDPVEMVKKGKINWCDDLRAEVGNRCLFYVHTTLRTHFFEVLEGTADDWVDAITKVHDLCFVVSAATRPKAHLNTDSSLPLSLSSSNSFGAESDATLLHHRGEV